MLRAHVAALTAIMERRCGAVIETPQVIEPASAASYASNGDTLRAAFEGWKLAKTRTLSTLAEFEYALRRYEELHGAMPITAITRAHVRQYREALQMIPKRRPGPLSTAPLLELMAWSKAHPEAGRINPKTVNKLLTGCSAMASWAYGNGMIPEDVPWTNPFTKMQLEDEAAEREPWDIAELRILFQSPVYTKQQRPKAGCGDAAYWMPLLGLYTGARLGELASLAVSDVVTDEATGIVYLRIAEDAERGRRVKTASSRRVVPVHPELIRLGFMDAVAKASHQTALFPLVEIGPRGLYGEAWSKWFGRYIRAIGITNRASVFHSFRHGFKDALRAAGISEDINDALTGHAGGGVGRMYGAKAMMTRFGLPRLAEAVSKVNYPGLDLEHLL